VREPSVFLLDEPLSNLDAKLRVQVRAEIGELQARTRTTMIYVTHDQIEAMTLGDRVAVLDRGRLQQVAPPRDLYDHPANAFVAGFIGNPPMNLFPTRLSLDERGRVVMDLAGQPVLVSGAPPHAAAVTAGIRPESLRLVPAGGAEGAVHGVVEHLECLGHETQAHVRVGSGGDGGVRLVARVQGMSGLAKGEPVGVRIDPERVHLFGVDGRALGDS